MELMVQVGEREERVLLERDGDVWNVTVGETRHRVSAAAVGGNGDVTLWSLLVDGDQHEVASRPEPTPRGQARSANQGHYRLTTSRGAVSARVLDPLTHRALEARGGAGAGGPATVTAYMPGQVVAVLVEEGDEVAAGQGVVVLEAMKMENEIVAEAAGVIKTLHVQPGQAVEGGDPLFEMG